MQETDLGIRNKKDAGATASVNDAGAREVSPPRGKLATKIYVDQKTEWSAIKPSGGIPKSDLSTEVQTSLGKADSAVQPSELPIPVAPSSDDSAAGKPADARATGESLDGKRGKDDIAVYTMSDWYDGSSGQTVAFRYDEASGEWIGEPGIIYAEGHRLRYNAAEGEWQYVLSSGYVIGLSTDEGAMELRPADYVVSRPSVYVATSNTLAKTSQIPTVPSAGTVAPLMDGAANAGSSANYARSDHVHPTDITRAAAADLRYALVTPEIVTTYGVPDAWFPITFTYGGTAFSVSLADKDKIVVNDGYLEYRPGDGVIVSLAYFVDAVLNAIEPSLLPSLQFAGVAPVVGETALDATTTATLTDRAANLITATDETSIDIELPAVQAGHSRDFYLAVTCGSTAPTLNEPTGVTLVNSNGEPPDLSLSADATTVLRFTEVKEADAEADPPEPAVFCVTGGANGGGSLDLSILVSEFSEQATYEAGDIVQYQGELYECQYPIETPGSWSPGYWVGASPVIPVLLSMIRSKADSSALDAKAESEALAPAWESGHAYFKGDHVSYNGLLYECLSSTVAGSTDPSADTTHWKLTDLATPDATLDILSDGRLRVVSSDGTPMWTQGYALASESAVALSCEKINKYVFAATTAAAFSDASTYAVGDRVVYGGKVYKCSTAVETAGAWTGATNWDEDPDTQAFALPGVPSGVVGDFVLDVDNTANEVPVMVAISGTLGTDYDLIVEKGRSSVDVLTIEGGALAELYFTMTAFGTAAKPAWRVVRLNVERQEVGA